MTILTTTINLIIALTLLNVWLFRFNKKTTFRGGNAQSMTEEFSEYSLPIWFMYLIGTLKVILAIFLVVGIWITQINLYCYILLSILMIGAVFMHLKINDPIIKSAPAISILILISAIVINNL